MALPNHLYRDPLEIMMNREAKTCKGCRFHEAHSVFDRAIEICRLGRKKLRKCGMYAEKGAKSE